MDVLSLSSGSWLFFILLQKAGGIIPRDILVRFMGIGTDIPFILNECKNNNLIYEDDINIYAKNYIEENEIISRISFTARNYSLESMAFCIASFINDDYSSFFMSSNKIIYNCYIDNNIDNMYICYEIIAKIILKIKIKNKKYSNYIDFISDVKNIQKYVTRVFLRSKYVFYVFYKIKAYAVYIGDVRTIYYVDLSVGAFNAINNNKFVLKNHELMKSGVEGIFSLGDEDLIVQCADFISLFYMLNGEYLKILPFYGSISHKFSDSQEDRSILLRVIFIASLCLINRTMYRKAESLLLNAINFLNKATLFEKKLIYSALGYIYMLIKKEKEAENIFLDVYNMKGYKKSFAHSFFISVYTYFLYTMYNENKNAKYKILLYNIINIYHIELTFMFIPCWFEIITSNNIREKISISIEEILKKILNCMELPFPAVQAISMRIYALFLFYDLNKKNKVENYLIKAIEICKTIGYHIELTKSCLLAAEMYEDKGDVVNMKKYLNMAWYNYIRTHQPKWPQKYLNIDLKDSVEKQLSILYSRNFFINLQYQNFFGYNQSAYTNILRAIILTFPLEKGIFIRYNDENTYVESCEGMDQYEFLSENFEHIEDMKKAISTNKYVIVSINKNIYDAHIADIYAYFFIPFKIKDESFLIYCCGEMRGKNTGMFSNEFFEIITQYIITEITEYRKNETETVKKKQIDKKNDEKGNYLYRSAEMKRLVQQVDRIAAKDTTVLLLGESGVGKEVLARRIHQLSGRSGAFVGVNIASTPQELFESEFYGHEKGSFTGANYQKKGLFELADNGTLFIDEVGDIPIPLQIKLLRVLQERQFMRVGGTKLIRSNFRLVAATNRNLLEKVQEGTFREDLYYRLNVVPVRIPPLRERPDDIWALAQFFLEQFSQQYEMELRPFSQHLQNKILSYDWPGNVRQLKNFVERYCLYMDNDFAVSMTEPQVSQEQKKDDIDIFEKNLTVKELNDAYFEYIFKKKNGIISGKDSVISVLGISKPTAHAWMNRLRLRDRYKIKIVKDDHES